MASLHPIRHATHRVRQTFATFDNPVELLTSTALSKLRRGRTELLFRVDGVSVRVPASRGAIFPIYEVFAEDVYRLQWFTAGLDDDFGVLDIGAHVGSFSLALSRLHPRARVDAYEASPTTASYLQRSVTASGRADTVHAYAEAVSTTAGFIDFTDDDTCSPLNTVTARYGPLLTKVPSIALETAFERLDGRVDLVKIDAEGAEYDIVLGSDPEFWSGVRRVVVEYHEAPGHDRDQLVAFFGRAGLDLVAVEPMIGNPHEGLAWFARAPFRGEDPAQ